MSEVMSATKRIYNRSTPEYIDKLPENVIQIKKYNIVLNRIVEPTTIKCGFILQLFYVGCFGSILSTNSKI